MALIAVSALIVYEAVGRLLHPSAVNGPLVVAFAALSLVGNALAALLLEGQEGVNARSAFLHLAGDAAASAAVLVGGLLVWLAHLDRVDPLLSLAIALWISYGAVKLIITAGRILLEGVPAGLDLADVEQAVLAVTGVAGVHDLHVWSVSSTDAVLSAHVQLANTQLSGATQTAHRVKACSPRPSASTMPRSSSSAFGGMRQRLLRLRARRLSRNPPDQEEPPCLQTDQEDAAGLQRRLRPRPRRVHDRQRRCRDGRQRNHVFAFWGLNILRRPAKVAARKTTVQAMFGRLMPRGIERLRLSQMNFAGWSPRS